MNFEVFNRFPTLHTERLDLKKLEMSHIQEFYSIFSRETVMFQYGMYPITELKDAAWFIERFTESFKAKRSVRWGLFLKNTNLLIGTCGFHGLNELSSRAEIGYELHDAYWHQGYMHEALGTIINWGFTTFDLNRIEALIYPNNDASEQSVKRFGFKYEGCLRQYAFFRDVYQDLNMFSLIRQEWLINEDSNRRG